MTLDELLHQLRLRRLILISEREVWPSPGYTRGVQRAVRRHQSGLKVLLRWSDISTCPAPGLHRQYWYHAGNQAYRCAMCERLARWIA